MRKLWIVAAAALIVAPVRADEAAEKVVKKAVEAHGGEKALLAKKAGEMTLKMSMNLLGMDLDFTGNMAYMFPDKYKMTMNGEVANQKIAIVQSVNGDQLKMTVNGMVQPLDEKQKAELKDSVRTQEISMIAPLLDASKYTLKAEKDAKVGDCEAAVVTVSAKGMKDTKLFFDKKTGLLIRTQRTSLDEGGADVNEVSDLTDYKQVDGIQTPMTMKVLHDGKPFLTAKVTQLKYHEKLDDKKFAHDD